MTPNSFHNYITVCVQFQEYIPYNNYMYQVMTYNMDIFVQQAIYKSTIVLDFPKKACDGEPEFGVALSVQV